MGNNCYEFKSFLKKKKKVLGHGLYRSDLFINECS